MTKRIVATIVLVIMALFVSWYAYQEYKKSQNVTETFIEVSQN